MHIMALFGVVALIELVTFIVVESAIGLGPTLLIALATAVLGSMLVRRAGMAVWADFRNRLNAGGLPARELSHGAAILVAGALLISPGFLTDTIGFLLLLPASRDLVYRTASKRLKGRFTTITRVRTSAYGPIVDAEGWEVSEDEGDGRQLP